MTNSVDILQAAKEGYWGIERAVEVLEEKGFLLPLDVVTEKEAYQVPIDRHAVEGPNGSGKSAIALQARRVMSVTSAFALEDTPQQITLPWIIGVEEPARIPLEDHVKESFGIPSHVSNVSYRELCKGYLVDPIPQLLAFILQRNRLHRNISLLRRTVLEGNSLKMGRSLPGLWVSPPSEPINYDLIDRFLSPDFRQIDTHRIPIEVVADRNEMSSVIYQGCLISIEYGVPLSQALRFVWDIHQDLIGKGYLLPITSMTVVVPHDGVLRKPESIARKDLDEYRAIIDVVDHEVDIPQQIFDRASELYLYLFAVNIIRSHPNSPQVAVVHNDPSGQFHELNSVAILASVLMAESSVYAEGDSKLDELLRKWIELVANRSIFLYMIEDFGFEAQRFLLQYLNKISEFQPEIIFEEGGLRRVSRNLIYAHSPDNLWRKRILREFLSQ